MSFMIKSPTKTPGVAIFRTPTINLNNLTFVEGTFRELEGNGTATLTFEGGYRYIFEMDFQCNNVGASGFSQWRIFAYKYYGTANVIGNTCNTRASSTFTYEQNNLSTVVCDATSDIYCAINFPNASYAGARLTPSASLTVWRFPL